MNESAKLASLEIVRYLYGMGAVDFPYRFYNDATGQWEEFNYEGLALLFESIIKHHYSEPNGDIPFSEVE